MTGAARLRQVSAAPALYAREERELEADREVLLASCAEVVPEALDALTGEERMSVYEKLQLEVKPDLEE